jgi:hypothetical protein
LKNKTVLSEYEGQELRAGRYWTEEPDLFYWGWQVQYKGSWVGFKGTSDRDDPTLGDKNLEAIANILSRKLAADTKIDGGPDFEDSILSILLRVNDTTEETEPDAEGDRAADPCKEDSVQHSSRATNSVS